MKYTKFHANPSRETEVTRGDKQTDMDFYYIDVFQLINYSGVPNKRGTTAIFWSILGHDPRPY